MSASNTTLESLVSNNKTKEAISQLIELIDDLHNEPFKQLTMLSSRYTSTNNGVLNQTEEHTSAKTEFSRIDYAFLNILSDVREEIQAKMNFYKPIPKEVGDEDILRGFLNTVLMKKYKNVKYFTHGNTFIYFQAQEKNSDLSVMVMVLKASEIKSVMDNKYLQKIAQLKHRNLIQLLDVNFQTYPYYIITEHVSGIDLKTLMQNIGALPVHSAKRLLLIIGDVMNSLKIKKFPYSGIRPSKILIDHELEPEISPFDILAVEANKRLLKSFEEDSYYFSNEILFNSTKTITPDSTDRANQFCLAALGYEMITGEKLFFGKNVSDILLMRHRFFADAELRKMRLDHPRLPKRMSAIFKKMLSEDPQKRYEDIPTALKEIAKVRVVMSDVEDKVFKSYRRCLNNTDDFMDAFYENLFAHPHMQAQKPTEKETERKRALQEKFYIDINMVFGVENFGNFVEKMATMQQGEVNPTSEYTIFLDAFIQTIEACDPRWDNSKDIEKAWTSVRNNVLEQLKNTFPEAETVSNYIPDSVLNTAQIGKPEEKKAVLGTERAPENPVSDANLDANLEANLEDLNMDIKTKMETSFDAEKA
jgi:Protein kinase domain